MCDTNSEDAMKIQKAWDNSREIIRNENDLINQRMTTFLTFQGFLFAGSAILVTSTLGKEPPMPQLIALIMVLIGSFVGFFSCYRTQLHIQAAARHIEATSEWWTMFREGTEFRKELPFPIIVGTLGKPVLTPWRMRQYLRAKDSNHRIAIEKHYEKLLEAIEKHYRKLLEPPLLDAKKERILNPSGNIVGSLPLILTYVWGFSFVISSVALIFLICAHADILQDILSFFSGKENLQSTSPYDFCLFCLY